MQMGSQFGGASGALPMQANALAHVHKKGKWSSLEEKVFKNACVCHNLVNGTA